VQKYNGGDMFLRKVTYKLNKYSDLLQPYTNVENQHVNNPTQGVGVEGPGVHPLGCITGSGYKNYRMYLRIFHNDCNLYN